MGKFKIIVEDSRPIYKHPYRRSQKENEIIKEEIEELLKNGFIRKSKSPWGFPSMLVPKPNNQYRLVIDYRDLNKVTISHPFPLPRLNDIFDQLSGSKWFTMIDLKSGFHQIEMHPESIEKTAFVVGCGHYEWLRLPFGLKNAPSEFCRVMYAVLGDIKCVIVYLDDICIHTKTIAEHLAVLNEVFRRLRKAKLKINTKKCSWIVKEVKILGHIIEDSKIKMDKTKIVSIINRKEPKNVKEVQVFLGLCNFYRKFIVGFADHVKPLTDLLNKKVTWSWDKRCDKAFNDVKALLTSFPVLRLPDLSKEFILYCDASNWALGLVLGQVDDNNNEYVCAYASRVLRGAEKNLSVTEKECLAVIYGLKEFRVYLIHKKFKIYTDHVALQWLLNIKDPVGKLYRWAVLIQQYDFEIVYKKGSKHLNADTLSRPVLIAEIIQENYSKDIYMNKLLLNFVKTGSHASNSSRLMIKKVESDAKHYKYNIKGIFYRKFIDEIVYVKVPKPENRVELISKYHALGHFAVESTYIRLKEQYYWYKMLEQIDKVIKNCEPCQRNELVRSYNHPALAIQADKVFEFITVDYVFGLDLTKRNTNGIMLITCKVSKWTQAYAISDKSEETTLKCFKKWIFTYGTPKVILSDNGLEFRNKVISKLCNEHGIEHRVTANYNPRCNGQVERLNQTLINIIRKLCENHTSEWDLWLEYVVFCYNTRVHSSTKYSPYELVFGFKANVFESNQEEEPTNTENMELEQRTKEINKLVETDRVKAKTNILKNQESQKRNQDKNQNVKTNRIPIGTTVFILNEGIKPKLSSRYKGPFTIHSTDQNNNYILKDGTGELVIDKYPLSKLKVVEPQINENPICEIEKILDHKVINNERHFLIKWKEFDPSENSWEREVDIQSKKLINKYLKNLDKINKPIRRSSRLKNNNLVLLVLLSFMVSLVSGKNTGKLIDFDESLPERDSILVDGNFKFCQDHKNKLPLDIEGICKFPEVKITNKQKELHDLILNDKKKSGIVPKEHTVNNIKIKRSYLYLDVYTKELNSVSGIGHECSVIKVTYKFTENLILNRFNARYEDPIKINEFDCKTMVKYKKCFGKTMNCNENRVCSYNEGVEPEYTWASTVEKSVHHCLLREKTIEAEDKSSFVLNTQCKASDYHCDLGYSVVVWEDSIVHRCPFKRIIKHQEFEYRSKGFSSQRLNVNFIYAGQSDLCKDKIMKTKEGVYLKFSDFKDDSFYRHTGISEETKNVDLRQITELTLASLDFDITKESEETQKQIKISCNNFKASIEIFGQNIQNKYLKIKDYEGKELILFAKEQRVYRPNCVDIKRIQIRKIDRRCLLQQVVRFINVDGSYINSGYMDTNGIISPTKLIMPPKYVCDYKVPLIFEYNSNKVIRKLFYHNTVVEKTALNLETISYIKNIDLIINHDAVLNEDFNVAKDINSKVNLEENVLDSLEEIKGLSSLRKTISKLANWTDNQMIIIYVCIAIIVLVVMLLLFAALIQCGISPCQCFACCCLGIFKGIRCCFTFYCCNKKFREEPSVQYNRNNGLDEVLVKQPSAPTRKIDVNDEFHKLMNNRRYP